MRMSRHLVFVYGTLKRGGCNHALLERATFVDHAHTLPEYVMIDGPYPRIDHAAEGDRDAAQIVGEVYRVDDATLRALDVLEDAPDLYRREQIEVQLASIPEVLDGVWIYVTQPDFLGDRKNTIAPRDGVLCWGEL